MEICCDEYSYHDSLQACLFEGLGQKNEDQVSVSQSDTILTWPTWLLLALYDWCITILATMATVNDWVLGYEFRYMLDQPLPSFRKISYTFTFVGLDFILTRPRTR